ncbi:helix-turn-helix transcriptional regulator [Variovorax sp. J22P271]|uniref:helix-turn-helix domain-containing protein n=1 Tax=Variovorax davisae TaxID=3053515 RepID=UPI00257610BA|nr:helix-turn-helix transcriptional regulator [Variovorax sp. J22P271]MDM0037241.1 helix-turn-helix transcriptional regulator [Variovorax sp. J22P271]
MTRTVLFRVALPSTGMEHAAPMETASPSTPHDDYLQMLGELVREAREHAKISQERFAAQVGLGRAYVGHVERGAKNVTLGSLMAILEGLETAPESFFRKLHLKPRSAAEMVGASTPSRRRLPHLVVNETASYSEMFGAAVRYERQRLEYSQEDFANEVELTRTYVLSLEQGKQNPSFAVVMRILGGLQLEPSKFFRHVRLHPPAAQERVERAEKVAVPKGQRKSTMRAHAKPRRQVDGGDGPQG